VPCRRPYCKATKTTPVECPWNKREQEGAARTTTAVGSVFFAVLSPFLRCSVCAVLLRKKERGVSKKSDSSEQ